MRIQSFDGRQDWRMNREYATLAAAKRAAREIFGWERCYTARHYYQADHSEWHLQLGPRPSAVNHSHAPIIVTTANMYTWRRAR